jgi:hypothetical protein
MPNTVTTRLLVDGPRHAIVHVYLKSDGASGELTNQVIFDPATAYRNPDSPIPINPSIVSVWYENVGFDALLKFDATTPVPAWKLSTAPAAVSVDFSSFGGIVSNAAAGANGKITLDTSGFTAATDEGTMIITIAKV